MAFSGVILSLAFCSTFLYSSGIPYNESYYPQPCYTDIQSGKGCFAACDQGCPNSGPSHSRSGFKDYTLIHTCICGKACTRPTSNFDVVSAINVWISTAETLCNQTYCGVQFPPLDTTSCVFAGNTMTCSCMPLNLTSTYGY